MVSREVFEAASARGEERHAKGPTAVAARYDRHLGRIVVSLSSGLDISFRPQDAQGLEAAKPDDLAMIEVSPSGQGIHFPSLETDLFVPALLEGLLGSRAWTAARMGTRGGKSTSKAKANAARVNGLRGGRPRKAVAQRNILPEVAGLTSMEATGLVRAVTNSFDDVEHFDKLTLELAMTYNALKLYITQDISSTSRDQLAAELARYLTIGDVGTIEHRSDGSSPSFILLIGSIITWAPLTVGASAFLKKFSEKIAERLADDLYGATKDQAKAFIETARSLFKARADAGGRSDLYVGINIPGEYFGARLKLTGDNEHELAKALAIFVIRSAEIAKVVQAEIETGSRPVGGFLITFMQDDRIQIKWIDQDLKERSLIIE